MRINSLSIAIIIASLTISAFGNKNLNDKCESPAKPGVDWSGCDKSGINLSGKDLTGANLAGAFLVNTNLANAVLTNVNLVNANLSGANFLHAKFYGAQMSGMTVDEGLKCVPSSPIGKCVILKPIWFKSVGGLYSRTGRVGQNCGNYDYVNPKSCRIIYRTDAIPAAAYQIGVRNQEHELIMMGWHNGPNDNYTMDSVGSIRFSNDPGSVSFDYFRRLTTISFDYLIYSNFSDYDYKVHLQTLDGKWHDIPCNNPNPKLQGCQIDGYKN